MRPTFIRTMSMVIALTLTVFAVYVNGATAQRGGGPRWHGGDYWQPGWMRRDRWGPRHSSPEMRARRQRHWTYMHQRLPKDYDGARSTIKSTPGNIAQGGKLYATNCASCHGKSGLGNGEAGKALTPSPALLAWMIQRPMAVDEYLLWTISEGGANFGTAMPAYKGVLKRDEIWKIIAYMRAGFPATGKK